MISAKATPPIDGRRHRLDGEAAVREAQRLAHARLVAAQVVGADEAAVRAHRLVDGRRHPPLVEALAAARGDRLQRARQVRLLDDLRLACSGAVAVAPHGARDGILLELVPDQESTSAWRAPSGWPFFARAMAGARSSASGRVPNCSSASVIPATVPGTPADA